MPDSPVPGISRSGVDAEQQFCALTGAVLADRAALGDAILDGHLVEIKKASSPTLNQVRAVKYLPLVVLREPERDWYVVPAHVVVRLCARKSRGQHTENPFESATLSLNRLGDHRVARQADLRERVLEAVAQADSHPRLRQAMERVLEESRQLARDSVTGVRELLVEHGLEP